MTKSKTGGWVGATIAIGLVMALAAWFLAISPTLANAADTRDQAQSQRDQNTIAKQKLAALKKQFENIDALRAELAGLQLQIPTTEDTAAYRRELTTIATNHSVTVVSLSTGTAEAAAAPVAPAPTPDAGAATAETGTETATDAAAPAPAAPTASTYTVPVTLDVLGTYDNVLGFLQDLQTGTQRLLLINDLSGSSPAPADAVGGKPAIVEGDLELSISGELFVVPPVEAAVPAPDPAATPTPLQAPNGRNPLLPLH